MSNHERAQWQEQRASYISYLNMMRSEIVCMRDLMQLPAISVGEPVPSPMKPIDPVTEPIDTKIESGVPNSEAIRAQAIQATSSAPVDTSDAPEIDWQQFCSQLQIATMPAFMFHTFSSAQHQTPQPPPLVSPKRRRDNDLTHSQPVTSPRPITSPRSVNRPRTMPLPVGSPAPSNKSFNFQPVPPPSQSPAAASSANTTVPASATSVPSSPPPSTAQPVRSTPRPKASRHTLRTDISGMSPFHFSRSPPSSQSSATTDFLQYPPPSNNPHL